MASTSSRTHGIAGRIRTAATNLYSDNQSLLGDIRKAFNVMKEVAVDLERANQFEKLSSVWLIKNMLILPQKVPQRQLSSAFEVKELENAAVELLATCDGCTHLSSAIQSVGESYQPPPEPSQLTDFEKLLKSEVAKQKAKSSSISQNQSLIRHFREAVWNVHHAGQPMPGDDEEDIVMTSTDGNIRNTTCPLSGKPITDLEDPVRSVECKHIYQTKDIMHYLHSKKGRGICPIAGCPCTLQPEKVRCDPLLLVEIQELRDLRKQQTDMTDVIEDFTELDED